MLKGAVYGGSFDPVHNGHLILATELIEALGLDRLVVVPAAWSPLKEGPPLLSGELRLEACRRAFAHLPQVEVSDLELRRGGRSFTLETVEALGLEGRVDLLIGADSVAGLSRWHRIEELAHRVRFVIASRPGSPEHPLPEIDGLEALRLPITAVDLASTAIRERHARGLPLEGWLPTPVAELLRASR